MKRKQSSKQLPTPSSNGQHQLIDLSQVDKVYRKRGR